MCIRDRHSLCFQVAVVVKSTALSDRLFQVLGSVKLSVFNSADFESKAVGSQVNGCQASSTVHCAVSYTHLDVYKRQGQGLRAVPVLGAVVFAQHTATRIDQQR